MHPDRRNAARELLRFYLEAGVDAVLGETPVDRLAEPVDISGTAAPSKAPPAPKSAGASADRTQTQAIPTSPAPPAEPRIVRTARPTPVALAAASAPPAAAEAAVMAAREAARTADSLDGLRAILQSFEGCALKSTASRLVFADGNPEARVMFVGEAPGRDEDIEGLPFVGRSGKLLDLMMAAIGLDRSTAYIANVVPWRPPGNRTPTPVETQICLPFIRRQIELVDPDVLVCLGGPAAQTLLNASEGITRIRGRWFPFHTGRREIRALPTYHPAYLLRAPPNKRQAWRDLQTIRKALAQDR